MRQFACIVVTAGLSVGAARADHVLLTDDLRFVHGRLVSIGSDALVYRDSTDELHTLAASACLGLFDPDVPVKRLSDAGVLTRTDGQQLPGRPELRQSQLVWNHALLGLTPIDLESTSSIVFAASAASRPAPRSARADLLLLVNGDEIEGIVDRLGANVDMVQGEGTESRKVAVPLERVTALSLVSPPRPPGGVRTWFVDGSVLDAERPVLERGDVRMAGFSVVGEERSAVVPLSEIRGIAFSTGAFTPLASLRVIDVAAPSERFHVPPPVRVDPGAALGLSTLRLSGPARFTFEPLPAEGLRLVATLRLAPEFAPWGDVEVVIHDSEGERWRGHLGGEKRSVPLDVVLRGGRLAIEIEEGHFSSIGDTVLVESAVLGAALPSKSVAPALPSPAPAGEGGGSAAG